MDTVDDRVVKHRTSACSKNRWKRRTKSLGAKVSHEQSARNINDRRRLVLQISTAAATIIKSDWFNVCTGSIVFVNCIVIGIEQSFRLADRPIHTFNTIEQLFLMAYIIEFLLQWFANGREVVKNPWHMFDLFLIILAVASEALTLVGDGDNHLGKSVLRVARLGRLARSVKLLVKIQTLWFLVKGLLCSAKIVGHTFVLMCIMLYVFAILGLELIRLDASYDHADPAYKGLVELWFPNIPFTMLSLLQFVCMDSIGSIYRPFIQHRTDLVLYFTGVILLGSFVFMNIVTAVIVNGALEQASNDKEASREHFETRKAQLVEEIQLALMALDTDNSGYLDREEVLAATTGDIISSFDFMSYETPVEVFDQLDVDGCGMLSIDDFCDALYDCAMSGKAIELKRIERITSTLKSQQKQIMTSVREVKDTVEDIASMMKHCSSITQSPSIAFQIQHSEKASMDPPLEEHSRKPFSHPCYPPNALGHDTPLWGRQVLSHLLEIEANIQRWCKVPRSQVYSTELTSTMSPSIQPSSAQVASTNLREHGGRRMELRTSAKCSESNHVSHAHIPACNTSACQDHCIERDESRELHTYSTHALPHPLYGLGYSTMS